MAATETSPSAPGHSGPGQSTPGAKAPFRPSVVRGILLATLGVSLFPLLNAAVKLLTDSYPVFEIVWARFFGHLVWVSIAFLPRRGFRLYVSRRPSLQFIRSLCILGSTTFFVSAIGQIPLATASAIGFTTPFIVTALSVPLLGEPVGWRRWAAVIVGFLGALFVVRPQPTLDLGAVGLILVSAFCYALYQLMTRKVAAWDTAETSIVWAALVGGAVYTVVLPFVAVLPGKPLDWLLFASIGAFGGFGHYFLVRAFQNAPAAVIAPIGYVELVGATLLGYLVWGNFPDALTWLGAAIIIACGAYVGYRERVRAAEPRRPA